MRNEFIWADLSSYQPQKIKHFYEAIFDWKYYESYNYLTAYKGNKEVVGLYETPPKFQVMKMPSFWMSYIQVSDVQETVKKARELGGIIELTDLENPIGGMALIRDALGAGFTVYEGNYLRARTKSEPSTLIDNELQVSDLQKAAKFYEQLFDWSYRWNDNASLDVHCRASGNYIAKMNELNNFVKGKYEYWVCTFGVSDLKASISKIRERGGRIMFDEGNRFLCSDGSEAFFYIQQV